MLKLLLLLLSMLTYSSSSPLQQSLTYAIITLVSGGDQVHHNFFAFKASDLPREEKNDEAEGEMLNPD